MKKKQKNNFSHLDEFNVSVINRPLSEKESKHLSEIIAAYNAKTGKSKRKKAA